jgi:hypothetical protein
MTYGIKKMLFVSVFMLLSTAIFAELLYTSEGEYFCTIERRNRNDANRRVSELRGYSDIKSLDRITNGQWECVQKLLNRYQHTSGDTFEIIIMWISRDRTNVVTVVCEFISNTRYNYWAFGTTIY